MRREGDKGDEAASKDRLDQLWQDKLYNDYAPILYVHIYMNDQIHRKK